MNKLQQVEEYFRTEAMSQSLLLKYQNHPRSFARNKKKEEKKSKEKYYEEKQHFLDGSLVDVLLTMPEHFEDLYYVDNLEIKPTDAVLSIIHYLYDNNIDMDDVEAIRAACEQFNYGSKWSDEVLVGRINNGGTVGKGLIKDLGLAYYAMLEQSKGKQIISKEESERANLCVEGFKTHPNTAWIWNTYDPDIKISFQVPLYSQLELDTYTLPTKGLIDVLVINHSNEYKSPAEWLKLPPRGILEIDIKTTSGYLDNYHFDIKKRRYDIQRKWYDDLLGDYIYYNKELNDKYHLMYPVLIVNSFAEPQYPKVYEFSLDDLQVAQLGAKDFKNGKVTVDTGGEGIVIKEYIKPILGIKQLLERYIYFEENGYVWDINENNGYEKTNIWGV